MGRLRRSSSRRSAPGKAGGPVRSAQLLSLVSPHSALGCMACGLPLVGFEEELTMAKRILVPLDESPVAEVVVPLVAAIARGSGATVRLLQVAPVPRNRVSEEGRALADADQEMERLETEGLDYLRTGGREVGGAGGGRGRG